MFDEKNECLQDVANTIRYELSYSKDKKELFERLFKRGILVHPEKNGQIIFKTTFNDISNEQIAQELKDDFFTTESLRNNIGYNIKSKNENHYYNFNELEKEIS